MKKILVLAGDFVEDYEIMVPYQALLSVGFQVDVVCPGRKAGEKIATAVHDFTEHQTYIELRGHNFVLNKSFDEVDVKEYVGLYVPGGRAPEYIRLNHKVLEMTQHFFAQNLPVAAICHGIQVLATANVIKGLKVTCYAACSPDVAVANGTFVDVAADDVVVDGNLVTSPAWPGHPALLREFYKLLGLKLAF